MLTGVVCDFDDGLPIAGASISLESTAFRAESDGSGRFWFGDVPVGIYEMVATAPGYVTSVAHPVRATSDVSSSVTLTLQKRAYQLEGIRVVGQIPTRSAPATIIGRNEIERIQFSDMPQLLETVPGVVVQRTGLSSGESRVSIRGSSSKRVLVLVDGLRINSAGDGAADLSSVPVSSVERIEVYKGAAAAEFGPDALNGVVNIITRVSVASLSEPLQAGVQRKWGRWGTNKHELALRSGSVHGSLMVKGGYDRLSTDGNFDFDYHVSPDAPHFSGERVNNERTSESFFISGLWQPSEKLQASLSTQVYEGQNGLAGEASNQDSTGYRKDQRQLGSLRVEHQLSRMAVVEYTVGWSRMTQLFLNDAGRPIDLFHSSYVDRIWDFRAVTTLEPFSGNKVRIGGEAEFEKLEHEDIQRKKGSMGETNRRRRSGFFSMQQSMCLPAFLSPLRLSLEGAIRYDHAASERDSLSPWQVGSKNNIERFSPMVGGALDRAVLGWRSTLRASYGRSLRLPALSALFWQGSALVRGNPDLRPELSEHSEVGLEVSRKLWGVDLSAGVSYFHSKETDLVVWVRGYGSEYRPVNLQSALRMGHEDFIKLAFWEGKLELGYQNTVTISRNKVPGHNSFDKDLMYAPRYVTLYLARFDLNTLYGAYSVRQVARRYAKEGNEKWYDASQIDDLCVGLRGSVFSHFKLSMEYRVYNLHSEEYVLVPHYPIPGREWSIAFGLKYDLSKSGSGK